MSVSLGKIQRLLDDGASGVILTPTLRDFVTMFEWERPETTMGLARDVYVYCTLLFLTPRTDVVEVDIDRAPTDALPHPLPAGCDHGELIGYWCDDLGRLLRAASAASRQACIGVACPYLLAGIDSPGYESDATAFPLVGEEELDQLEDAYVWDVPSEAHDIAVSFDDARRNLRSIGATSIDPPSGGSHYKVRFNGARSWPLDPNVDPIPDRFLRELVPLTHLPLAVIKFALRHGKLPQRVLSIGVPLRY